MNSDSKRELGMKTSTIRSALGVVGAAALATACAHTVRPFPLAEPIWEDQDRHHVKEEPAEYYSGLMADAADKNIFRPLARAPYLPLPERAKNVNSLDEVPNSSWFQNRIGFFGRDVLFGDQL